MNGESSSSPPRRASRRNGGKCPICGAPSQAAARPFCSARCAQIDLGRWLQGSYRIPTQERPPEPGEDDPRDSGLYEEED